MKTLDFPDLSYVEFIPLMGLPLMINPRKTKNVKAIVVTFIFLPKFNEFKKI